MDDNDKIYNKLIIEYNNLDNKINVKIKELKDLENEKKILLENISKHLKLKKN